MPGRRNRVALGRIAKPTPVVRRIDLHRCEWLRRGRSGVALVEGGRPMIRRLVVAGAALGILMAAAVPVAAHGPGSNENGYSVNVLVSDATDSDLVNGWGLSRAPASPWWVADNGTGKSTLYKAT